MTWFAYIFPCPFSLLHLLPTHIISVQVKSRNMLRHGSVKRPCSHFADTCGSETIFVADRFRVHANMMLSATQTGTIPLRSKKWSETISEYFPQNVNNMKRNKKARKVKAFQ